MKLLDFIIIFFIPIKLFSQQQVTSNLLENPSFEISDLTGERLYLNGYFSKSPKDFETRCLPWIAPWNSKPTIIDSLLLQTINGKTIGNRLLAAEGRRFIELIVHGCGSRDRAACRDYVGQKLKIPLKKGNLYKMEMDVGRSIWVAINKLGCFFSEKPIEFYKRDDLQGTPIQPQIVFDSIACKIPMIWYRFSVTFQLNRDASYLYVGNFAPMNEYQKIFHASTFNQLNDAGYYYFDNFSLTEVQPDNTTLGVSIGKPTLTVASAPVRPNGTVQQAGVTIVVSKQKIILNNMLFATKRADLKTTHLPELDGLYDRMFQNQSWTVVITGHTDNIGSVAHNQQLSENRATTIAQYLQNKGIDAKRIQKRGVGATQPIADNQTPEGREKNRRVEIEINQ